MTTLLLLAPLGIAIYGLTHNRDVWQTWQFWMIAAACEFVGGWLILLLTKKYAKHD